MASDKTRLDEILDRLKNHRIAVWILALGVFVIALATLSNALHTLWTVIRPVIRTQVTRQSSPSQEVAKPVQQTPSANDPPRPNSPRPIPECRYLYIEPLSALFEDVETNNFNAFREVRFSFDGRAAPKSLDMTSYWSLVVLKNFGPRSKGPFYVEFEAIEVDALSNDRHRDGYFGFDVFLPDESILFLRKTELLKHVRTTDLRFSNERPEKHVVDTLTPMDADEFKRTVQRYSLVPPPECAEVPSDLSWFQNKPK